MSPLPQEMERPLSDAALQLEGLLYGYCPVQGEGTVAGQRFYFRARWDEWSLAIATRDDVDPVGIERPEQGFLRTATYGNASWMDYDDADRIVRRCAEEFLATRSADG